MTTTIPEATLPTIFKGRATGCQIKDRLVFAEFYDLLFYIGLKTEDRACHWVQSIK